MWAGFCALVNEARQKAGQPLLPYLNPLLYPLNGTSAFRDVTAGSNGAYTATRGYDLVTGLGAHARSIAPLDYDAHTSSAGGAPA